MATRTMWRVSCTYGNAWFNATYAVVPSREDAYKLKPVAESRGYRDVYVHSITIEDKRGNNARSVRKETQKDERGPAVPAGVDTADGELHDLPAQPEAVVAV